jgi:hypothetical protein
LEGKGDLVVTAEMSNNCSKVCTCGNASHGQTVDVYAKLVGFLVTYLGSALITEDENRFTSLYAYPVEGCPTVLDRNWILMFGSKTVADIKCNKISL